MAAILSQIEHIVLVVFENRSFDNVLGWLYDDQTRPARNIPPLRKGEREFEGLYGLDLDLYKNELWGYPTPLSGKKLYLSIAPIRGARAEDVPQWDPHEDYLHVNVQLFNRSNPNESGWKDKAKPDDKENPKMNGFLQDFASKWALWDTTSAQDQMKQIMETYTPAQLPILNGLARQYAVCDQWFSSVPSQTNPNRAFLICGTSLGKASNENELADELFWDATIFNKLESWGLFYHHKWLQHNKCYTEYTFPEISRAPNASQSVHPIDDFFPLARAGTLPDFSFIEAAWYEFPFQSPLPQFGSGNDYHPPGNTLNGERLLGKIYDAIRSNQAAWEKTLLVITFDEHGGTFDHVAPPWGASPPDIRRDPDYGYGFNFDRFGVRVPTLLISPWIEPGTVFRSTTSVPYDHASIIATIQRWKNIVQRPPNPDDPNDDLRNQPILKERVTHAPTFEGVLTRSTPRRDPAPLPDDIVSFSEGCFLKNQNNFCLGPSELGIAPGNMARQYYPTAGKDGVRVKLLGGIGQVRDGAVVLIESTEDVLGKFNVLGAWKAGDCYYYETNNYAEQKWIIKAVEPSADGYIHYGKGFYLLNQNPSYPNYGLARDDRYLTTKQGQAEFWFLLPA